MNKVSCYKNGNLYEPLSSEREIIIGLRVRMRRKTILIGDRGVQVREKNSQSCEALIIHCNTSSALKPKIADSQTG